MATLKLTGGDFRRLQELVQEYLDLDIDDLIDHLGVPEKFRDIKNDDIIILSENQARRYAQLHYLLEKVVKGGVEEEKVKELLRVFDLPTTFLILIINLDNLVNLKETGERMESIVEERKQQDGRDAESNKISGQEI